MTVDLMRSHLDHKYKGWMPELKKMPDAQVIAIYCRVFGINQRKPPYSRKGHSMIPVNNHPVYLYFCNCCYARFASDNPQLEDCRECGTRGRLEIEKML